MFTLIANAEETIEFDDSVIEFSKTMGIEELLSSVLSQTRDSMKSSMSQFSDGFEKEFPNMSQEQRARLNDVFENYIDSVMDSIDTKAAAHIYIGVLAENMSASEMETASEYYRSPEGKNLMKTVGKASTAMNEYLLSSISGATKTAMVVLGQDINGLREELANE